MSLVALFTPDGQEKLFIIGLKSVYYNFAHSSGKLPTVASSFKDVLHKATVTGLHFDIAVLT